MDDTATVDRKPALTVVSAKIPKDWDGLLETVALRRGDQFKGSTIRELIRAEIERHFPGATTEAA